MQEIHLRLLGVDGGIGVDDSELGVLHLGGRRHQNDPGEVGLFTPSRGHAVGHRFEVRPEALQEVSVVNIEVNEVGVVGPVDPLLGEGVVLQKAVEPCFEVRVPDERRVSAVAGINRRLGSSDQFFCRARGIAAAIEQSVSGGPGQRRERHERRLLAVRPSRVGRRGLNVKAGVFGQGVKATRH